MLPSVELDTTTVHFWQCMCLLLRLYCSAKLMHACFVQNILQSICVQQVLEGISNGWPQALLAAGICAYLPENSLKLENPQSTTRHTGCRSHHTVAVNTSHICCMWLSWPVSLCCLLPETVISETVASIWLPAAQGMLLLQHMLLSILSKGYLVHCALFYKGTCCAIHSLLAQNCQQALHADATEERCIQLSTLHGVPYILQRRRRLLIEGLRVLQ